MVTFFVPGIKLCFSGTKFHYIFQALTFPQKYAKLTLKQSKNHPVLRKEFYTSLSNLISVQNIEHFTNRFRY